MNGVVGHWKRVFSDWRYSILALAIALFFYLFNVALLNYQTLISFFPYTTVLGFGELFFSLSLGLKDIIEFSSFISLIFISVLIGVLFSLIFYKSKLTKKVETKETGFISTLGIILAAFVPGCAACGIGLASALGISGAFLGALPFKGIELSVASIALLIIAIFKISNSSCKVMLNNKNLKMKGGLRE